MFVSFLNVLKDVCVNVGPRFIGPVPWCVFIDNCICTITGSSKAKKMKLTVKGGAAVDPDSGTYLHGFLFFHFCAFFQP